MFAALSRDVNRSFPNCVFCVTVFVEYDLVVVTKELSLSSINGYYNVNVTVFGRGV